MGTELQEFFRDLTTFFADPASLCNRRTIVSGFTGLWRKINQDRYRKIPLLLTVTFHLAVLLLSVVTPYIMTATSPKIPEIYTVNLYKVPEEGAPPLPPPRVVKVATPVPKKPVAPKPVEKETVAPPPVEKVKISLAPVRQRLEKERKEKEARKRNEEQRERELEQLRLGYLEERAEKERIQAEREAQQAEQALAAAKTAAAARIAELYKASDYERRDRQPTRADTGTGTDKGGSDQQKLEALDRYRARLFEHISPHWQLPELQEWDENLRAVIVMQVNRDGTVTGTYFEKLSKDSRFNRYVQKAVDNAQPLPPFPIDFHEKREEIVVTFSPGGLL
jgi:outer membrane biosynthesis protein TonB